jgi:hypothetical protein
MFIRPMVSPTTGGYDIGMMSYTPTDRYEYALGATAPTTNKQTSVFRIDFQPFTGSLQTKVIMELNVSSVARWKILLFPSDHPTVAYRNAVLVEGRSSVGVICSMISNPLTTGKHMIVADYDATAGTGDLSVDGVSDIQFSTITASTLLHTTLGFHYINTAGLDGYSGDLGYIGYSYEYGVNHADFGTGVRPTEPDTVTWAEWGGLQPYVFNRYGKMSSNEGFGPHFTRVGLPTGPEIGAYDPKMMTYPDETAASRIYKIDAGYVADVSNNAYTAIAEFQCEPFTGDRAAFIFEFTHDYPGMWIAAYLFSSDYSATPANQNKLIIVNLIGGSPSISNIRSEVDVCDGQLHTMYFAQDATTGDYIFKLDGVDTDDLTYANRAVGGTNTENTTAGTGMALSITANSGGGFAMVGKVGYIGLQNQYLTNWTDFVSDGSEGGSGSIKELDTATWTEFNGQPLLFAADGDATINLGSFGNLTKGANVTGPA